MSGKTSQRLFRARLERMIDQLKSEIQSGALAPGDFLPSESALAEQFGLSNKSVRQGLDQLVAEGLIRKIPRVGNQVTEAVKEHHTTITLGINSSLERDMAMSALLESFMRRYPSVRVQTITIPGNSRQFVKEYTESAHLDAFIMNHQFYQEMEESGLLPTLEPLSPAEGAYRLLVEGFTADGVLYGQPLLFSPIVLCYNKDHFRDAGLPEPDSGWTWRECAEQGRKLTRERERFGFVFFEMSANRWPVFLLQSGTSFCLNRSGVCDIEGTPMLEAIRQCDRIIHDPELFPRLLTESNDDIGRLFVTGKVSMMMTSYMSLNELKHTGIRYDISPLPYVREPRTLTVAMAASIRKSSVNKQAARLLVDYLISEEAQMLIRRQTLSIPALKSAAEAAVQDEWNRPRGFDLFRDILPSMRFHRELNLTNAGFGQLWDILKAYWSHMIDEAALCSQIRERVSDRVRRGGAKPGR
ncbi:extracellular solute-binding protein [Paenibacillus ginsengarvi]|uniref:extracellular solute-binding protein n=1 Tax=Paenibacillus ginsengarvi TaxID=400777 RepID=UPI0013150C65|nr:extracellular solute-binding protein [Paenibacillus ginsengarvi]